MTTLVEELDAKGLACPLPLLKAKQALSRLSAGQQLRVMTTDSGSVRDFKVYAELSVHHLVSHEERDGVYYFVLEKC